MPRYMVVEHFSDPKAVYERVRAHGRQLPDGLRFVDSWVDARTIDRCFQLMDADTPDLLDTWIAEWADLGEFEVIPVISSAEASERALQD